MIKLSLLNRLLLILGFGFYNICKSQNLIQNGSFENYTNIDCTYGGFDNATVFPAVHVVNNWYTFSTPDYFSSVCTNTYSGVPINLFGNQFSKQGNAYAGFGFYQKGNETKEYIYQHLSSQLIAGKQYCMSFFLCRAERSTYATSTIEAYFSSSIPSMPNGYYINAIPQIVNQSGFVTDTIQWTKIQGCFTASGGEEYVTIGNFNSNVNTDTLFIGTNNPIPFYGDFSYYYIDSVSLVEDLSTGINKIVNDYNINIYPNPANSLLNIGLSTVPENTSITIVNTLGEIVIRQPLNEQKTELNIGHLQSGIYYYQIAINGKSIKNDKIIVIK